MTTGLGEFWRVLEAVGMFAGSEGLKAILSLLVISKISELFNVLED